MANSIYPKGREAFAAAAINWAADNIKLVLLSSAYTYSDAHDFLNDIGGGSVIATSGNLAGKTNVGGVLDANDVIIPTVSGADIVALAVYKDTGSSATSPLILFLDATASAVLIHVTPDGGSVRVQWSNGPLKMFRL